MFEQLLLYGGSLLLVAGGICALVRVVLGPTVLDRVIAADVLLTTVVLILGLEMIVNGHTNSVSVMIGVSATAALATITVARFVRRKENHKQQQEQQEAADSLSSLIDVAGSAPEGQV